MRSSRGPRPRLWAEELQTGSAMTSPPARAIGPYPVIEPGTSSHVGEHADQSLRRCHRGHPQALIPADAT
jgi:hypothetical protein